MPMVQAGQVSLEYDEAGSGGNIAVLIHGASSSHRQWAAVQRCLADAGVHSYAFSMRGAGASGRGASESDYAPASYARDLAAALDTLGLRRFSLVGHSLGTLVSRYYVRDHADRVRALALIAGPDPARVAMTPEERAARAARPTAAPPGSTGPTEAWLHHHAGLDNAQRTALWRDIQNNPPARARGQESPWPGLEGCAATIPAHTLVLLGDADEVVPPEGPLRGYLELAPERRHLHVFTGIGHFPPAQIPERTAAVLLRFISTHAEPA